MKIKNAHIIILFLIASNLFAQQDFMTNNKLDNLSIINPAFKAFHKRTSLVFHHRSQWLGFYGAPVTDMALLNSKDMFDNISMGGEIINDNIGPTNNFDMHYNFTYSFEINRKYRFVLGAKAGFNIISNKYNNIKLINPNDQAFIYDNKSAFTPIFGFGAFFHTYQFYAGISSPNLLENKKGFNTPKGFINLQRHFYFITGGKLLINKNELYLFEPKLLIRYTKGAEIQYDINLDFQLYYKYIIGITYRSGDVIGLNLGFSLVDDLMLLYSFGYSYSNKTFENNGGSHEIMLRYLFPSIKKIKKTKRRHRIGKGNKY